LKSKHPRSKIAARLLVWFDRRQRDLPWRRDRDPYRIWVSEVMLQQTQVATVIPYFERFLAAFPRLADLAAADEQDVLRLWAGLGYYRRARDLHRAARQVVAEHAGRLPTDPDVLRSLPGFGRYTCNAVLSQAHDLRLPILEANSARVLSRLLALREDPRQAVAQKKLWQAAEDLLPARRAGAFNQALMELGALVCTAQSPHCSECPLAEHCQARWLGLQDAIPARAPAPQVETVHEVAVAIRRGRQVLLVQRPASASRWANMWELPHAPVEQGDVSAAAAGKVALELTGLQVEPGAELLTIRHGVTRFRITLSCFEAGYRAGDFASSFYVAARWLEPADLLTYPISSPQRRLAAALQAPNRQRRLF
jgi:A/G-specific adenine glycosylase